MTNKKEETMKLAEALARLETVVAALDRENTDLEDALRLYEEGVRLVAICRGKITEAERRIKLLKMTPDGEVTEEEFKPE